MEDLCLINLFFIFSFNFYYYFSPNLTWRDLQHIIVATARPTELKVGDWVINGAGYHGNNSLVTLFNEKLNN